MMRKTNEGQSPVGILLPSVLAGLLGTLLLMLLGAVLVHRGTLAEGAIAPCALVFLALGSALAVFLILLIVAVLPLGQSIHFVRTVISLLCSLIASALGGYAGANMRKKKRYSHIKK